ncbi:MAG TPA: VWA domain-containing protein [Bacteroidota bacterium]|nr:VWA domain-containing protein [Bacteroidota bacterium]
MIRFAHIEFLYALAVLPVMALAYWLFARSRANAVARLGNPSMLERLADDASRSKRLAKLVVLMAAVACLLVALANPRIGTRLEDVKQEGVDIFIALDVSLSMKSEDIKPNRLEKAKFEIRNLIGRLAGDRIGLIVFAGEAFTQFPLTTDYSAANMFLDIVDVDAVPVPGTDIGSAIEHAVESFDFEETTTKVLVIITDGENTEGDVFDAAEEAAKKGVLIYTIGLGSPTGSPIPVYNASGEQVDFKRDKAGAVVISKLDEASLEKLASVGGGKYFRGTNAQDELDEIYKNINALQKKEYGVKQFTDYEDRFQFFLVPAIALLLLEVLMTENRLRWLAKWNPLRNPGESES